MMTSQFKIKKTVEEAGNFELGETVVLNAGNRDETLKKYRVTEINYKQPLGFEDAPTSEPYVEICLLPEESWQQMKGEKE